MKLYYIASPYTADTPALEQLNHDMVCAWCARQIAKGFLVYSPIAHSHTIAQYGVGKGWKDWATVNRAMLAVCDELVVLLLNQWRLSAGVAKEIEWARELGMAQSYLDTWDDLDTDNEIVGGLVTGGGLAPGPMRFL